MMRGGGLVQRQEAGGGSEGKSGGAVGDERQGQEHQPGLEPGALGGGGQVAGKGKGGGGVVAGDVRQCQCTVGGRGRQQGSPLSAQTFSFLGDLQFAEAILRWGSVSGIHCHRVFSIFTVVAAVILVVLANSSTGLSKFSLFSSGIFGSISCVSFSLWHHRGHSRSPEYSRVF
jgi:hypothetical protein